MKNILMGLLLASVVACCPAMASVDGGAIQAPNIEVFEAVEAIEVLAGEAVTDKVAPVIALASDSPITDWVLLKISQLIGDYPVVDTVLSVFGFLVLILGPLANWTKNPRYSSAAILLNKLIQLLTFGSAKNQPDVLSVKEMLTNKPRTWPSLIRYKRQSSFFKAQHTV